MPVRTAGVNQQRVPRVERHTQSAVFCAEAGGDCQGADSKAQAGFWAKDSRETLTKPFLPLCKKLAERNPLAVSHHAFAALFRALNPRASVMVDHWPIAMAAACFGLELVFDALPVGFHTVKRILLRMEDSFRRLRNTPPPSRDPAASVFPSRVLT